MPAADQAPAQLTITLWDEPPKEIAPGTLVEIEVVEQRGPAAVYADLLAHPTGGPPEHVLAADWLLQLCRSRYQEARKKQRSSEETGTWGEIARMLQLVVSLLLTYRDAISQSPGAQQSLGEAAAVLAAALDGIRASLLHQLRRGTADRAIWACLDSEISRLSGRLSELARAGKALICELRAEAATPTLVPMVELLAAENGTRSLRNHEDLGRAMILAERIGLDPGRLQVGLYQGRGAATLIRGVKR